MSTPDAETRPAHVEEVALRDLAALLGDGVRLLGDDSVRVSGVSLSTQRVQGGDLYAALPGTRAHGAQWIGDAVASGAVAVLTDEVGAASVPDGVPVLVVPQPRRVLGAVSARVYADPAARLRMVAVTGTQGKTTTTRLLEGALHAASVPSAVIGTVGTRMLGREVKTQLTTPEAPDLQGLLARMVEDGVDVCAMEVSSHALVLGRVDGVVFAVAVFTNLGRDHLDFHADQEDYFRAKASLFTPGRSRLGLVNVDDEHGRRLVEEASVPIRTLSVRGAAADWRAVDIAATSSGSTFTVVTPQGDRLAAGVPLAGDFNVANALAAIAAAGEVGLDPRTVGAAMAEGPGVPGRLERVEAGQDFEIVVDYAHKPDAVQAALDTLRPLTEGQLIVVLGAGGDRDPGKRPIMGRIAAQGADVLIVTDDNPRTEDPASIRRAVLAETGDGRAEVVEIGDRRKAITDAVRRARAGDIVLIAGKGHETGQEIHGQVHEFDDRVVAAEAVRNR